MQLAVLQRVRPFVERFEAYGTRCLVIQDRIDFAGFAIAVVEACGADESVCLVVVEPMRHDAIDTEDRTQKVPALGGSRLIRIDEPSPFTSERFIRVPHYRYYILD